MTCALRCDRRAHLHDADEVMARIIAGRPVEHLERSEYVAMHKLPLGQHGAPGGLVGSTEKAAKVDLAE